MNRVISAHQRIRVIRVAAGRRTAGEDRAATEEPLEVRLDGRPFAVIMRTPGADRELAAGFLLSEGVVKGGDDLGTIEHCQNRGRLGEMAAEQGRNTIDVTLTGGPDAVERALAGRRHVAMNSSCGLCGRLTIDSILVEVLPLPAGGTVTSAILTSLPGRLRAVQTVFDATGGLHAAALFAFDGTLETSAEDVGRHNAVDKVVGRMLMLKRLPLSDFVLFVSGRTSFEIVQKAFLAGIPVVASVSAPSSLAVDLADEAGMTLVGFVRDGAFNIYSHERRVL